MLCSVSEVLLPRVIVVGFELLFEGRSSYSWQALSTDRSSCIVAGYSVKVCVFERRSSSGGKGMVDYASSSA